MANAINRTIISLMAIAVFAFVAAAPALASSIVIDGKYDVNEGYTQSYTLPFYASNGQVYNGSMYTYVESGTNNLAIAIVLPLAINDTSYGSTSTEAPFYWPGGKGRSFSQIVGSDHLGLSITSSTGDVLIDALIDNLAKYQMKDGTVEYHSTGVTDGKPYSSDVYKVKQGDGQMLVGDASSVLASKTSYDYNYNVVGYTNTDNSPTQGSVSGYIDQMIYEILIDGDALTDDDGNFILGGVGVTLAHLSPEKIALDHIGTPTPDTPSGETPEPGTMLLLGSAFIGFGVRRFWRR